MSGPDTPPVPPEPGDEDWPDVLNVQPEPKSITVVCAECNELIRIRDVHAYVLSNHLRDACQEMTLLNGNRD